MATFTCSRLQFRVFVTFLVSGAILSGCSQPRPLSLPPERLVAWSDCGDARAVHGVIFMKRPTPECFQTMAEKGVDVVVGLVPANDVRSLNGLQEDPLIRQLGMTFVHMPVTTDSLDADDVERLKQILREAFTENSSVVIFDEDGNRTGALWALYVFDTFKSDIDEAIEYGSMLGLSDAPTIAKVRSLMKRSRR